MKIEEQENKLIDVYIDLSQSSINSIKKYLIINTTMLIICINVLIFDIYKGFSNESFYTIFTAGSIFTIIFFLILFIFEAVFDYIHEKKTLALYQNTKSKLEQCQATYK